LFKVANGIAGISAQRENVRKQASGNEIHLSYACKLRQ